jgi:hypothetical protein
MKSGVPGSVAVHRRDSASSPVMTAFSVGWATVRLPYFSMDRGHVEERGGDREPGLVGMEAASSSRSSPVGAAGGLRANPMSHMSAEFGCLRPAAARRDYAASDVRLWGARSTDLRAQAG